MAARKEHRLDWLERKLARRAVLKTGVAGTGAVLVALYVKPGLRSVGVPPAYAHGTKLSPELSPPDDELSPDD